MSRGESWVSDELQELLLRLTAQQARGVLRIVQGELEGRSLSSLLDCDDQICASTTYYGTRRRTGWRQKPDFRQAVELARRDYRSWMLEYGVNDALIILAETAPHAARALRQQILGDDGAVDALAAALKDADPEVRRDAATQLGATGLPAVVPALRAALKAETDPLVRQVLVAALGHVAGLRDDDRRAAALGVLDRADVKTAGKGPPAVAVGDQMVNLYLADLGELSDEELDQLIANLEAAESGAAAGEATAASPRDEPGPAGVDDPAAAVPGVGEAI